MATALRAAESTLDAISRIAEEGLSAQVLIEQVADRMERVVPTDGYFLAATDPDTTLSIGMGVVSELPADWCQPTWEHEFLVPDFLKYADIVRSGRAVADIHDATGGRPERSARFREYSASTGYHAELRLAFTVGEAAWGIGQLNRAGAGARFTEEEKDWLERAAPLVARGLRRALLSPPEAGPAAARAGIVLLDQEGGVVSATRDAEAWLDELDPALLASGTSNLALPFHTVALAARLRAAHQSGEPALRARMRTRRGVWLLMHGAPLEGTDQLALVIEPAKAADVAPLIVEAYGLTPRELDVTRAIARGLGTAEIAAHLHLSAHTVRDHIKAVFEKVGVSSRGELVHKVFAEHYAPPPHEPVGRSVGAASAV
jgi:DNA-binding CsgD family transcriptional regulator